MASTGSIGVDMNDDLNLELYSQLHLFKNTLVEDEFIFHDPNKERQRVLQSLAHKLDLECEYSLDTRIVRITRSIQETGESSDLQDFGLVGFGNFGNGDRLFDGFFGLEAIGSEDLVAGLSSWTAPPEVNDARGDSMPRFERTVADEYMDKMYSSFQFASNLPTTVSSAPDAILEQQIRTLDNPPLTTSLNVNYPLTIPPEELSDPLAESHATPSMPPSLVSKKRKNSDRSLSPQDENKRPDEGGISSVARLNSQDGSYKCERINPSTGKPCNSIFPRLYDLTRHDDTIHNARKQKFHCPLCTEEKTFSGNDALIRHIRVAHPDCAIPRRIIGSSLESFHSPPPKDSGCSAASEINPTELRDGHRPALNINSNSTNIIAPESPRSNNFISDFLPSPSNFYPKWDFSGDDSNTQIAPSSESSQKLTPAKGKGSLAALQANPTKPMTIEGGKRQVLKVQIPDEQLDYESAISSSSSGPQSPCNPLLSSSSFSRPPRHRHDSVGSNQNERGRSGFRTPPNGYPNSPITANYQDGVFIFDSRSARSSSQNSVASITSVGSAASGRRGPLSEMAKAGMKAVRKLGACWKCKFLRKTCNPENPCSLCQSHIASPKSNWNALGCKRGTFTSNEHPIVLCPSSIPNYHYETLGSETELWCPDKLKSPLTDKIWKAHIHERDKVLTQGILERGIFLEIGSDANESTREQLLAICGLFPSCFQDYSGRVVDREALPSLKYLYQWIISIGWECIEGSSSLPFPESRSQPIFSLDLLPAASRYQAEFQNGFRSFGSNQLISLSLLCLRSCLELQRLKSENFLGEAAHELCVLFSISCKLECISVLQLHIESYYHELSRVFFEKNNMRNKRPWWLSTFYSFCIQSLVRKTLIQLDPSLDGLANKEYLYNPIRLFIAISSSYDPIMQSWTDAVIKRHTAETRTTPNGLP